MNITFRTSATIILITVMIVTGFLLARKGAPYPVSIFTIHKLSAMGGAVLLIIPFIKKLSAAAFPAGSTVAAIIFMVSVIMLIASGAIMSIKSGEAGFAAISHRAAAVVSVCSAVVTGILL